MSSAHGDGRGPASTAATALLTKAADSAVCRVVGAASWASTSYKYSRPLAAASAWIIVCQMRDGERLAQARHH